MSEEEYEKATEELEKEFDLEEENYNHQIKMFKRKQMQKKILFYSIFLAIVLALVGIIIFEEIRYNKIKLAIDNYIEISSLNKRLEDGNKKLEAIIKEAEDKTSEKEEKISIGKQNAVKQAQSYLSHSAFSKKGLREQLEFEGYTKEEADYAIEVVYK